MGKISKETKSIIKSEKTELKKRKKNRNKFRLYLSDDYNELQYFGVIKKYLCWKYDINSEDIDKLLYLYPVTYFTFKDYRRLPVSWGRMRWEGLFDKDIIEKVYGHRKQRAVYRLTRKGKGIVRQLYKLLRGDVKLPTSAEYNKSFRADASFSQLRFRNIMRDMRELVESTSDSDSTSS